MKLPFTIKLGAVTGVFSRLNPKAVLGKLKGLADVKGLIAKVKGKLGAKKGEDEDELEEDEDMFGDLGDLDALDVAAKEGAEDDDAEEDEDAPSEDENDEAPKPESSDGGDEGDDGDDSGTLSELEDMPDFDDDELDGDDDEDDDRAKKKKLALIAGGGVAAAVVLGGVAWLLIGGGDAPKDAADHAPVPPPPGTSVFSLDEVPAAQPEPAAGAGGLQPPTGAPAMAQGGHEAPEPTVAATAATGVGGALEQLGLNVAQEPGAGLVVPSMTKASFAALAPWPPSGPLEKAPIAALVEQADIGPLPKVAEDGNTSFKAYARPETQGDAAKPKLAIIVTSMGTSRAATDAALSAMPSDVTFALDVYARGLDFWVRKMRASGHEVLLEVPSESADFPFQDLGPNALQSLAPLQENAQKLGFILSRTTGYFGVLTVGGGKFLKNEEQVQGLMAHLKHRGLMYVDGGAEGSMGSRVAYKEGLPWAAVELDLDKFEGRAALLRQLAEAESMVQRRAMTVVRVTSTPLTMAHLSTWIRGLDAKGIRLIPVSALSKKQLVR